MTGILAGMMVAFKQIKPEQELSLSSIGLRVKVGWTECNNIFMKTSAPYVVTQNGKLLLIF